MIVYSDELYHHGIQGMKWGVRRYQNEDGSLTSAGRARYDVGEARKAAVEGGLIGYARYRKTHSGRSEAVAKYKADKAAARQSKSTAKESKTHYAKDTSQKMKINKTDSALTKQVKKDYNSLDDAEFMRRYSASKKTYAKRVDKYGDPYKNSPLAQAGKKLNSTKAAKKFNERQFDKHRNAVDMGKKAAIKTLHGELKIKRSVNALSGVALAAGRPVAASAIKVFGNVVMVGYAGAKAHQTYKDIKTSNEYLDIQKRNNDLA